MLSEELLRVTVSKYSTLADDCKARDSMSSADILPLQTEEDPLEGTGSNYPTLADDCKAKDDRVLSPLSSAHILQLLTQR